MALHSTVFPPSSAARRIACAASAILEANEPDRETEFAAYGTLGHAVAGHCLINNVMAKDVLKLEINGKKEIIPSDMVEPVQEYVDYIREQRGILAVEQSLPFEWLTGEKDGKGTADAIISSDEEDSVIVVDLKLGMQRVEVRDNAQLLMYALGAVHEAICEPQTVKIVIHQPRINYVGEETVSIGELKSFEKKVRKAVTRIGEARKSNTLEGFYSPGESQCRFCKAAYKCPAYAALVVETTGVDFNDLSQTQLIEPINLGNAMNKIEMVEIWCRHVRAKVEADLLSGRPVKGWKLVQGKLGNRKWSNEDDVVAVGKAAKLTNDEIYSSALLTPAKMEKKLKSKPKIWQKLQSLIVQKPGEPSVAPSSDPRPVYDSKPQDDFEEVV